MAKTILVIDSDSSSASVLSKTLEAEGYLVFTSASAEASLTMAKKVNPSVIFLSLSAQGVGLEICKEIRSIEGLSDVPIVLLTIREGKYDPRYRDLYGIVGFLKKPLKKEDILSSLNLASPKEEEPVSEQVISSPYEEVEEEVEYERTTEPSVSEAHKAEEEATPSYEETTTLTEEETPPKKPLRILIPVFALVGIVIAAIAGYVVYRLSRPTTEARPPAASVVAELPTKPLKKPSPSGIAPVGEAIASVPEKIEPQELPPQKEIAQKPIPPAGISYFVQLGAFSEEKNALKFQNELKANGLDVSIQEGVSKGKKIYRVIAASLKDERSAKDMALKIKKEKNLTAVVIKEGLGKAKPTSLKKIEKAKVAEAKGIYFVQLGAFSEEKNALEFQKELKTKGLETQVHKGSSIGKTIYRVIASTHQSKYSAINAANSIREKKKLEAVVTKKSP